MSMTINQQKCVGCRMCENICPGNIISLSASNKAYLKRPSDCWHCMACIKECPASAISLVLPPELEGRGGELTVKTSGPLTEWTVNRADGTKVILVTDTREANNY